MDNEPVKKKKVKSDVSQQMERKTQDQKVWENFLGKPVSEKKAKDLTTQLSKSLIALTKDVKSAQNSASSNSAQEKKSDAKVNASVETV